MRPATVGGSGPGCTVDEPVVVEALGIRGSAGAVSIRLEPPPTLACQTVRKVAQWLDQSVQPLAKGGLDADLASLRVGGGHECRGRNRRSGGPLSEHSTGKALDIFAFEFVSGSTVSGVIVEKPGGLRQQRFLDAVRASACGTFSTVLGPGSDAAHANHLHLDTQDRRSAASRYCG